MPDTAFSPIDPVPEIDPEFAAFGGSVKNPPAAVRVLSALLRFAFRLLYYQLAFTYDLVAWIVSAGEWADWRRCVIPFLPPGRVLEIAHGTGTLLLDMAEGGYPVTGIDLSGAMGKIARGKIRRRRKSAANSGSALFPGLVQADVNRLPFQAGAFAAATSTFPADFLFQQSAFQSVHRALRPGGVWIILPAAYPEWFAGRWLPDEKLISSGAVWRTLIRKMEAYGFRVRMEIVRRPRSRVLLIMAEKR
ncbi:MAG: class I SAM-dependent methyltransferase [Anaerolineales bacterium]|nr:class I SAM-dependent methyltransferase [Anaerolineales bacterium]